jgi:hypothetical protein
MATVKKVKKAAAGAVCGPGPRKGSCKPGSKSPFDRGSSKPMKTEGYKPGKRIKFNDDDEPVVTGRGIQEKPFERDFPGDKAPAGFDQRATGKKGTRWTTDKGKMKYAGQSFKNGGKKVVKKAKHGKKVVNKSKKK